ncbi:transglycosylase SLT domain protein [Cystobacter fuscus]|uniref:Transglycosylase SLT domain protein n=1 Tax=Cystobacter fuscus TaxID=43 RepID=A0A250IW86_9BACT|nr:transglycosylase SLT domain-containing protein [Cystobacter fuscus]ATB35467.1 transglycosylase SLT domain protein [Cystobacter fuscus]
MSVSSVSGNKAAALLALIALAEKSKTEGPSSPTTPSSPTPLESNPPSLFNDGFTDGTQGNQWNEFLQTANEFMETLGQLQELLAPELGDPSGTPQELFGPGPTPPQGQIPGGTTPEGVTTTPGTEGSGSSKLGPGLPKELEPYRGAIESASAETGVPANMLAAQIWQESRGNLAAVSTNGGNGLTDTGLMQVNPNTYGELQAKHPALQGKDLSDPANNILAGAYYMKDMKEQFGDWKTALRAYNSGPNGVDKSNLNALPAGTGDATYVDKVSNFWSIIESGNGTLPP